MLDQIGRHGMLDLSIKAKGDLHIDDHHTIEDIGITLGEAFNKAVGDKKGIRRYGHSYIPWMKLFKSCLRFSGRPGLFMKVDFVKEEVGGIDVNMFEHFFSHFVIMPLLLCILKIFLEKIHITKLRLYLKPSVEL